MKNNGKQKFINALIFIVIAILLIEVSVYKSNTNKIDPEDRILKKYENYNIKKTDNNTFIIDTNTTGENSSIFVTFFPIKSPDEDYYALIRGTVIKTKDGYTPGLCGYEVIGWNDLVPFEVIQGKIKENYLNLKFLITARKEANLIERISYSRFGWNVKGNKVEKEIPLEYNFDITKLEN